MMVDGAISGPPPETGTGAYGGFRHSLAPPIGPQIWAESEVTTRLTGSESPFLCLGAAENSCRLGERSLDYSLTRSGAAPDGSAASKSRASRRTERGNWVSRKGTGMGALQ
ncbi:hypothetical protein FSOLCH5_015339 [Fusarium solani]